MNSLRFLGVRVDDVTAPETLGLVEGFMQGSRPRQIATVNPEFVMAAQRLPEFAAVLNAADLCVPDGVGLMWGAWLLRRPLRSRVPGVDLVWRLAEMSARRGCSLFLLGGRGGAGLETARRLTAAFPDLRIAGVYEGSPADPDSVRLVAEARADILLVAFGAPAQDLWIHRHLPELNARVCMGVGGSFDFISGRAKRAPAWLRAFGLEWLHRLVHEPWRWRRMLALPQFAILVLRQRWTS